MAIKYSIYAPSNPNFDSPYTPGFITDGTLPLAIYSSPDLVFGGYDTAAEALQGFVDNCTTILNGSLHPVVRVSYPYLATGVAVNPYDDYLPDYGGYYSQFDWSINVGVYYYTVYTTDNPSGYDFQLLGIYAAPEESAPEPPPAEVTIQLKRDGGIAGTYSVKPSDSSHLPKYYAPVKFIRASFDTTRIAIIEDTLDGGFMIYEEIAGSPSGSAFIYSGERRLVEVIDATNVAQYRARYVP